VDRPTVTYLLQGQMTYHQDGKPNQVVNAGDGSSEGRSTAYWGGKPVTVGAVWIAVDIPVP